MVVAVVIVRLSVTDCYDPQKMRQDYCVGLSWPKCHRTVGFLAENGQIDIHTVPIAIE